MPPFLSVIATQVIFTVIGLHLLAVKYGWYWQLGQYWKQRRIAQGRKGASL